MRQTPASTLQIVRRRPARPQAVLGVALWSGLVALVLVLSTQA